MEDHEGPGWHLVGSDRESHQGQNAPPCLTRGAELHLRTNSWLASLFPPQMWEAFVLISEFIQEKVSQRENLS